MIKRSEVTIKAGTWTCTCNVCRKVIAVDGTATGCATKAADAGAVRVGDGGDLCDQCANQVVAAKQV